MSKKKNSRKKIFFIKNDKKEETKNVQVTEIPKKSFFKKWFRWDVITGIATILMLILAIIGLPIVKPVDEIKNRIKKNISIVETTFNPSAIKQENESSKYLSLLADLQQSTIDYCTLWKTLNDAEPYSKYSDLPPGEIVDILSKEFNRIEQLNEAAKSVMSAILEIQMFELLKDSSKVTSISHAKQNDILSYVESKGSLMNKAQKKCLVYLNKANEDTNQKRNYKKNLKKGLEVLDDVKKNVDNYRMDDAIIEYAIECNKLFNISKRYYMDK